MSGVPGNILWFIIAISVLVAVHEYGHYIVGRLCGMKVLRFSIGFGKPLVIWTGKDPDRTEYCISRIPLGGYVKFLDDRDGPVEPEDQGRAFTHRPVSARIAVLLAGPMFNFLFAIFAYWILFIVGVPALKPAVGQVTQGSYAAEAGLEYGDRIIAVGDRDTLDWETALLSMIDEMVDDGQIPLRLRREAGGTRLATIDVGTDASRLTEPGLLFEGLGFVPWRPPAVIGSVEVDSPAANGGILAGDQISKIDGEVVYGVYDLLRIIAERPNKTVPIEYLRDGRSATVDVALGTREQDGETIGRLGASISGNDFGELRYDRQYGPVAAVGEAVKQTWHTTAFTVRMLANMLTGNVSFKNISGPISIAQYAGDSAAAGIDRFIKFLAVISISLGALNLLPIPILDGGQIVYQAIEWLKGSPLSMRAQILGQQAGILALLVLMSFAVFNDIARIFG
jgi:regulator of sigma E protease